MSSGKFIVFEGPEGAGKSTQIALLAGDLTQRGCTVLVTREPGGSPIGEQVRQLLLDRGETAISPTTEAFLMNAARAQHVETVIRPALERGEVVICDRFTGSTLAYQGGGRGGELSKLTELNALATGGLEPDLVILLDLPAEQGLQRRRADTGDQSDFDRESQHFHSRVRETFLQLAASSEAWVVLDATQPAEKVAEEVAKLAWVNVQC